MMGIIVYVCSINRVYISPANDDERNTIILSSYRGVSTRKIVYDPSRWSQKLLCIRVITFVSGAPFTRGC